MNQPLIVRDGEPLTANPQLKLATAKEEVRVSTDVLDVNVFEAQELNREVRVSLPMRERNRTLLFHGVIIFSPILLEALHA